MKDKIKRYVSYVDRFMESPRKTEIFKELINEIKQKGPVKGIQSLLHIKSSNYIPDPVLENFAKPLDLPEYNTDEIVSIPFSSNPQISIIIPIYNQVELTYKCVRSIIDSTTNVSYEIIIANDRSTESISLLENNIKNLKVETTTVNSGFLLNCNNAAQKAKGDYIVFLNNDTIVLKNWLEELLAVFNRFENVGLAGSKLVYPNGLLQEAGGIIWKDGSAINYGNRDNPEKPEYNYVKEVDYISGASIMISRKLWNEIGGFDTRYSPAYNEDSDLCFEIRKRGYKVIYQPFSVVVHFEGMSHGTDTSTGIKKYQIDNQKKFAEKWNESLAAQTKDRRAIFNSRDRSSSKKHILIVDHNVPTLDKDAGSRTINNFVDCFIEAGCCVHFLVPNMYPEAGYAKQLQEKGVEVLHGEEFVLWKYNWKKYFVHELPKYHAVLLSRASVATAHLKQLRKQDFKGKIIYYGHDLGYLRTEQEAITTNNKALLKVAMNIKEQEDFMYQNSDGAFVISEEEQKYLEKYITKPLHYVPPYYFETEKNINPYTNRSGILFVGGFGHPPNLDAMIWFLDNIYPNLYNKGIILTIAGALIPESIFEYKKQYPNIQIKPNVPTPELEELYKNTRLAIVPLQVGAGVKGKVIEAMAKGVPIVGTDRAFEGMPKPANYYYTGQNSADSFYNEVIRLYNDNNEWQNASNFGTEYIKEYFNKKAMLKVFKTVFSL